MRTKGRGCSITAVNRATGTISFTAKNAHVAGFSITSAQTATLQQSYAGLVAQMGQDAATATTASPVSGNPYSTSCAGAES